jgi:hypothetical protein
MLVENLVMLSFAVTGVRTIRTAIGNCSQAVIGTFADPYRPEVHYMRGPGPKWQKLASRRSTEGHRCVSTKPADLGTLRDTENRQHDDNSELRTADHVQVQR